MVNDALSTNDAADAPSLSVQLAGFRIGARRMPASGDERGGDWCEAFLTAPTVIAISIGDVSGHGAEKWPTMAAIRATIRAAAHAGYDAVETLVRANRLICSQSSAHATALFGLLDTKSGMFTFANAGHPPPLMAGRGGTSFIEYERNDLLLGFEPGLVPQLRTIGIPDASLLVFYTDGISEAERRPLAGMERLRDAADVAFNLASSATADIIEALLSIGTPRADDASILTLRTPIRPYRT